eukprot:1152919-Pelagomonas_calceolata.AAC.6
MGKHVRWRVVVVAVVAEEAAVAVVGSHVGGVGIAAAVELRGGAAVHGGHEGVGGGEQRWADGVHPPPKSVAGIVVGTARAAHHHAHRAGEFAGCPRGQTSEPASPPLPLCHAHHNLCLLPIPGPTPGAHAPVIATRHVPMKMQSSRRISKA